MIVLDFPTILLLECLKDIGSKAGEGIENCCVTQKQKFPSQYVQGDAEMTSILLGQCNFLDESRFGVKNGSGVLRVWRTTYKGNNPLCYVNSYYQLCFNHGVCPGDETFKHVQ